jgi:hypothetical protein
LMRHYFSTRHLARSKSRQLRPEQVLYKLSF